MENQENRSLCQVGVSDPHTNQVIGIRCLDNRLVEFIGGLVDLLIHLHDVQVVEDVSDGVT